MDFAFSPLADALRPSEIRELLRYSTLPGLISFGGGMPHPSSFPVEEIRRLSSELLKEHGTRILQYGPTQGWEALRSELVPFLRATERIATDKEHIVLSGGSQQALYALFKLLTAPGDPVLCASPTYIGTLSAARANGTVMLGIPVDDEGVRTELLEERIRALSAEGRRPRLIYLVPNFQNPSGVTLSLPRRKHVLELAARYEIPIVEDNPYGELRYEGSRLPSLKSLDTEDRVIYLGTFSKVLAPGLRVGYTCAPAPVVQKMNLLKQATILTTNTLAEAIAGEYLRRGYLAKNLPRVVAMYRRKRDTMLRALETNFGPEASWSHPLGGMFLWLRVPEVVDTTALLPRAVETQKVAYVSGAPFFPTDPERNTMRLNFTFSEDDQIVEGIRRLAEVIHEAWNAFKGSPSSERTHLVAPSS